MNEIAESSTENIKKRPISIHLILFILTVVTTILAGIQLSIIDYTALINMGIVAYFRNNPGIILSGVSYSFAILLILGFHEMGHFYHSRKYGVNATLPYFIPAPPFIFIVGTFGAVIKIKSPINFRKPLVEIGAAGPIASFLLSIPVTIIGLKLSRIVTAVPADSSIVFGESIIFRLLSQLVFGNSLPPNSSIFMHPLAFAGWFGFFATALNLIPIGQLDGGHLAYALLGKNFNKFSRLIFFIIIPLGILWPGWFIWAIMLIFLGIKHPRVYDDNKPLTPREILLIGANIIIFILCFIPRPVYIS